MDSTNQIGKIASGILVNEFDFISDIEKQSELLLISGSLSSSIGELNILLNQSFCFEGTGGHIQPPLGNEEISILEELYLRDYNSKQARKILRGSYDITQSGFGGELQAAMWTELKEGDTTIKRPASAIPGLFSNRLDLSKHFKALATESEGKIKDLAYAYNMYGAVPRQVAGSDAPDIDYLLCQTGAYETFTGYLPTGTGVTPSGIGPSGIGPSGIGPSGIGPSGIGPSGVEPSGIEPSGIRPSGIEPSGIEPSGIEPSGIGPSGIEPSGIEPSGIEPSGFKYSDFTGIDLINDYRVAFNIEFIENNGGGEVEYPEPPFIPGEKIKLNPKPEFGYKFQYWSGIEPSGLNVTEQGIFEMPRSNVTISGYYI